MKMSALSRGEASNTKEKWMNTQMFICIRIFTRTELNRIHINYSAWDTQRLNAPISFSQRNAMVYLYFHSRCVEYFCFFFFINWSMFSSIKLIPLGTLFERQAQQLSGRPMEIWSSWYLRSQFVLFQRFVRVGVHILNTTSNTFQSDERTWIPTYNVYAFDLLTIKCGPKYWLRASVCNCVYVKAYANVYPATCNNSGNMENMFSPSSSGEAMAKASQQTHAEHMWNRA